MTYSKWIERYNNATKTHLRECYKRPSLDKEIADCYVRECCESDGGYDLRIIGHNTFTFSVGYKLRENGIDYLKIHTFKRTFKIKL